MSPIERVEARLKAGSFSNEDLTDVLDELLSALLSLVPGFTARSTDGVLLERSELSGERCSAAGLAILIADQVIEPVAFELAFQSVSSTLEGSSVCFGVPGGSHARYGSRQHGRLSSEAHAEPRRSEWQLVFNRNAHGWSVHEAAT